MKTTKIILVSILLFFLSLSTIYAQDNETCFDCHSDPDMVKEINDSTEISVYVDEEVFSNSVHGDFECVDCHTDLADFDGDHDENLAKVNCADCHEDVQEEYNRSVHAPENAVSHLLTASCKSCHGYHNVLASDETASPIYKTNIQKICADCHTSGYNNTATDCFACHEPAFNGTTDPNHTSVQFPVTCEDCHSTNAWKPSNWDHDSQYFPIYSGSHRGKWDTCTDCHENTSNYKQFECINCHEHNKTDMDRIHSRRQNYEYTSIACYDCHPNGKGD